MVKLLNHDGLLALKADLQTQIKTCQAEHDVDAPTARRTQAAAVETAAETRSIQATAREWDLVEYRLGIDDAIERYSTYTRSAFRSFSQTNAPNTPNSYVPTVPTVGYVKREYRYRRVREHRCRRP